VTRGWRGAVTLPAIGVLLAGPTALAFFSGGYFDEPRLVAALAAWTLVLLASVVSPQPVPASGAGRAAVGGLALLCAWTALSLTWAPLAGRAADDLVRLLLYLGAFVAAAALLRGQPLLRAVEPALAAGAVVVIGYGLAGHLLPDIVELHASARADGRLEQPLTYWNAEGVLSAMGLLLCARLAGDRFRPIPMRILAAACCGPLGAGIYLTLSRGAMVAAVVGFCVLLAVAADRSQLRAVALAASAAITAALGAAATDEAVALAILVSIMFASGLACAWIASAERRGGVAVGPLGFARRLPAVGAAAVVLALAGLVAGGLGERGETPVSGEARAERLVSVKSRRYDYWRVSAAAFADHPLRGVGSGGFSVVWLRERPVKEGAVDAHSLPLETAAELGLVGVVALALFLGGVGLAARRAAAQEPELVAGALAATTAWLLHAAIDWDWEMPAVTLPALVMAGGLVAGAELSRSPGED
jgi:hypothetical protein